MKHYRLYGCLALLLALCLTLSGLAVAQEEREFSLIAYPETTDRATNAVGFGGVPGESYALWQGFEGTWQDTPQTVTLALDEEEGAFTVECVPGVNDFVLTGAQAQSPQEEGGIAFQIVYTPVEPTEAPAEPTEAPAEPTEAPAEPTEAPAEPTEAPAEPTEAPAEPTEAPAPAQGEYRTLKLWTRGDDVLALQQGLAGLGYNVGREDGIYGPRTRAAVMRFQRAQSLTRDGMVGEQTRQALAALGVDIPAYVAPDETMPEGFERILQRGMAGMDVRAMQEALIVRGYLDDTADHIFGNKTRAALRAFQRDNGLRDDGVAGPETLRALMEGLDIQVEPDQAEPEATAAPEATAEPEVTAEPEAEHPNG